MKRDSLRATVSEFSRCVQLTSDLGFYDRFRSDYMDMNILPTPPPPWGS